MKPVVFFITGTDTGVGKTVLTCLLTRHLRARVGSLAALKLICSGGREDARLLGAALGGDLALDEINPWHFRAPLAPLLAARREKKRVTLAQAVRHVRMIQMRFPVVIIEGAGGLLSPLGENFDARDLIQRLRAVAVVVCPNRLGAINQVRLTLAALPMAHARRAQVVLVSDRRAGAAARTNPPLLAEWFDRRRIHVLPRLRVAPPDDRAPADPAVRRTLNSLTAQLQKDMK